MTVVFIEPDRLTVSPLTTAETFTLQREGLLWEVCPGVMAAHSVPASVEVRAAAAQHVVGHSLLTRVVVGWTSAAWIHGWAPPRPRLDALIDSGRRTTNMYRANPRIVIHEVTDPLDRSVNVNGLFVSDRVRTVLDVARYASDEDAETILPRAFQEADLPSLLTTFHRLNGVAMPLRQRSRMRTRIKWAAARSGVQIRSSELTPGLGKAPR